MRIPALAAALAAITITLATPPAVAQPAAGTDPAAVAVRPKPRLYKGTGDDVVRIRATKERGVVKVTHKGDANFAVWAIKPNGKRDDLLVNVIGDYSGSVVYNLYPWNKVAAFKIEADGDWTLQAFPISSAPLWKTATVRLKGDRVLKLKAPSKGVRSLRYRHSGDGNFAVYALPESGSPELLVNKIGKVSGKALIPPGTRYVYVRADGAWMLRR